MSAYEAYSPTYLSAGNAIQCVSSFRLGWIASCFGTWNSQSFISDGFFFAMYTAVIVHVCLYYHKELITGFKSAFTFKSGREECKSPFFFSFSPLFSSIGCKTNIKSFNLDKDIHNRLMSAYKEVPEWWSVVLSSRRWTPASSYPLRDPSGISSSSSLHWSQGLYTISNMILATPFGHSL